MRCSLARRYMMDCLFETLSLEARARLETHLEHCPSCAREWNEARQAHRWIHQVPDRPVPYPVAQAVLQQSKISTDLEAEQPTGRPWSRMAAAAGFLIFAFASYPLWFYNWNLSEPQTAKSDSGSETRILEKTAMERETAEIQLVEPAHASRGISAIDTTETTAPVPLQGSRRGTTVAALPPDQTLAGDSLARVRPHESSGPQPAGGIVSATDAQTENPVSPSRPVASVLSIKEQPEPSSEEPSRLVRDLSREAVSPMAEPPTPTKDDALRRQANVGEQLDTGAAVSRLAPSTGSSFSYTAPDPSLSRTQQAEAYFKLGLKLYNNAFTKIGDEQRTLLESAIITLNDVEKKFPDQPAWVAFSLILIADSYRALDRIDDSIRTYRAMIERFASVEPYTRQARISLVKMLLQDYQPNRLHFIEQELNQLAKDNAASNDYASLALRFSELIETSNPAAALDWNRTVIESSPIHHPIHTKAVQLSRRIEDRLRFAQYVRDWRIIGPFPESTAPMNDANRPALNLFDHRTEGLDGFAWLHHPYSAEESFSKTIENVLPNTCLFAKTYVFSPRRQAVVLKIGGTDGARIWLNRQPVAGDIWNTDLPADSYQVVTTLNKGWNQLLVKSYHLRDSQHWTLSVLITDRKGKIVPGLIVDSTRGGALRYDHN